MEKIKTKILQTAFSDIIIFYKRLYYYSKDASSFALRISWLKIEPMSQFFLSQKAKAFCDYCYGNKFLKNLECSIFGFLKIEKKTSHCSMSTRSQTASSAGKFETLGSNFSQETPKVATGVLILQYQKSFFLIPHQP